MALALKGLSQVDDPRVLIGHNNADDAGVLKLDDSLALVTTVDLLAPVVDDPYDYGFIAAINCLSDIYAMGGDPLVCLNVVGWPTRMNPEILGEIMAGSQARRAGPVPWCSADTLSRIPRSGTDWRSPGESIPVGSQQFRCSTGDDLILTKPLGTGTVIQCAISRGAAPEGAFSATLASMKASNAAAARVMRDIGANACTDVTGFGFLGHCWEMASGSEVGVDIRTKSLPLFPMVHALIREGIIDGSHKMNMNSFREGVRFEADDSVYETLLYSSETSGGLLIAVEPGATEPMLAGMRDAGLETAAVVGTVVEDHPGVVRVC